jgi:1-acyl-sn-glycerol-3-phosphate acyltransferase
MKHLRACYRLLFFALYTILKSNEMLFANLFLGADMQRTLRIRRRWARVLLPRLGYRLQVQGTPPDFPCLLAANHRSYLDPAVLAHDVLGYGVAKAEVASWPVIGWGARIAGVLFLRRESLFSRRLALDGIADKIREGFPVILFVEGTTNAGPATIAFKPGSFKLAAQNGFTVVPVAIEFCSPDDYWIGDDTFLPHLYRRLSVKEKRVRVHYGPPLNNPDYEALMAAVKTWIDRELDVMRKGF